MVNPPDIYSPLRAAFAEWYTDPNRNPATQKEWAAQHGVSEFTVSRWKSHPEVAPVLLQWRERLRLELGRCMSNMVRIAGTGDGMPAVQAARLLVDVYGELEPTRVQHEFTLAAYVSGRLAGPPR